MAVGDVTDDTAIGCCEDLRDSASPQLAVLAIFLIFLISVLGGVPTARANSTLVQQNNGGCTTVSCSPSPISFPSSVTAGDVIVVMIAVEGSGPVSSVSDTLGSTFTLVAEGTR